VLGNVLICNSDVLNRDLIVAAGFAGPRQQQPSQFGGSGAFVRPPNPSTASSSAFSSVIGGREDRGLRKSFGTSHILTTCGHVSDVLNTLADVFKIHFKILAVESISNSI